MPPLQKRIHSWFVGMAGSFAAGALYRTWHVRESDPGGAADLVRAENGVIVFWHRFIFPLMGHYRGAPLVVPVSEHQDGEYVAQAMQRMGFHSVRGSTTHGALRLMRKLLQEVQKGYIPAITPDGPRGPRYSVQPGFLLLARRLGLPVYTVGVHAESAWVMSSWDRFVIPRPFTTIGLRWREVLSVAEMEAEQDAATLCGRVRERMMRACDEARQLVSDEGA